MFSFDIRFRIRWHWRYPELSCALGFVIGLAKRIGSQARSIALTSGSGSLPLAQMALTWAANALSRMPCRK